MDLNKSLAESLQELESVLVSLGFQPGLCHKDGLTATQVEEISSRANIVLPEELKVLYQWKSGLRDEATLNLLETMIFNGCFLNDLEHAIESHRNFLNRRWFDIAMQEMERDKQEQQWPELLLDPSQIDGVWEAFIDGCGNYLLAGLPHDPELPCPIIKHSKVPEGWFEEHPRIYPSVHAMIRTTIAYYQEGAYFLTDEGLEYDDIAEAQIALRMNPDVKYWKYKLDDLTQGTNFVW